jgi:hypothetical protein
MSKFREGDLVIVNIGDNSVYDGKKGIVSLADFSKSGITYLVVSRDKKITFGRFMSELLVLDIEAIAEQHGATLSQPTLGNVPIKNVGLQTHIEARFDCVDPVVMKLLAECRGFGVNKYGEHSHKKIPVSDHLNHAINHINEHRRNDKSELHLVNAICRLMFAISQLHEQGQYVDTYWHPDMLSKPVPGEKNE